MRNAREGRESIFQSGCIILFEIFRFQQQSKNFLKERYTKKKPTRKYNPYTGKNKLYKLTLKTHTPL